MVKLGELPLGSASSSPGRSGIGLQRAFGSQGQLQSMTCMRSRLQAAGLRQAGGKGENRMDRHDGEEKKALRSESDAG